MTAFGRPKVTRVVGRSVIEFDIFAEKWAAFDVITVEAQLEHLAIMSRDTSAPVRLPYSIVPTVFAEMQRVAGAAPEWSVVYRVGSVWHLAASVLSESAAGIVRDALAPATPEAEEWRVLAPEAVTA